MRSKPTLKEVSKLAGVSTYTASRALSGSYGVAEKTRQRVQEVARDLGYVPNQIARSFRVASSDFVGFLTANSENLFYVGVVAAFQRRMQEQGYNCFVTDAVEDGEYSVAREDLFISAMLQQRAAGIVLSYLPTQASLDKLASFGMPIVFVDCVPPETMPAFPAVSTDGCAAAVEVGELFATLGRHRWGLVAHASDWSTRQAREDGFRRAAERAGASVTVLEGRNDMESAEKAVTTWLRNGGQPDAILCTNEILFNGTLRALSKTQWRVPEDVALVSFDDFPWADLLKPPVSVVAQPTRQIGETAAEMMLNQFHKRASDASDTDVAHVVLPTRLIRRGSCGSVSSSN